MMLFGRAEPFGRKRRDPEGRAAEADERRAALGEFDNLPCPRERRTKEAG
jgi:hypothetical protein